MIFRLFLALHCTAVSGSHNRLTFPVSAVSARMRRECSSFAALLSIFSGKTFIDFFLESCLLSETSIDFCLDGCLLSGSLTDVCLEICLLMPLPSIGVEGCGDRGSTSNCEDRCRSRWSRRTCLWPLSAAISEIMLMSS